MLLLLLLLLLLSQLLVFGDFTVNLGFLPFLFQIQRALLHVDTGRTSKWDPAWTAASRCRGSVSALSFAVCSRVSGGCSTWAS